MPAGSPPLDSMTNPPAETHRKEVPVVGCWEAGHSVTCTSLMHSLSVTLRSPTHGHPCVSPNGGRGACSLLFLLGDKMLGSLIFQQWRTFVGTASIRQL